MNFSKILKGLNSSTFKENRNITNAFYKKHFVNYLKIDQNRPVDLNLFKFATIRYSNINLEKGNGIFIKIT